MKNPKSKEQCRAVALRSGRQLADREVDKQMEQTRGMPQDNEVIKVDQEVKHDGEVVEEHKREQGQSYVELSNKRNKGPPSPWNFEDVKPALPFPPKPKVIE